jgi:hypothetical protein
MNQENMLYLNLINFDSFHILLEFSVFSKKYASKTEKMPFRKDFDEMR